jgi:transposase-like protein
MKKLTLLLMDSIAVALAQGYMLARSRLTSHPSPVLRLTAIRDSLYVDAQLLRRQVSVFQRHRSAAAPKSRPHFGPAERLEILQIMRLRDWSAVQTAREFILHPNTIRAWIKELHDKGSASPLFTATAWNRIDDAIRWAAQQIRSLCPEPEIGTRTIARLLVRAGAKISRATVQRVLREKAPTPPANKDVMVPPTGSEADKLLKPKAPSHVWHADLSTIRFLTMSFIVAVVMDGFSRKVLKLRVYAKAPTHRSRLPVRHHVRGRHEGSRRQSGPRPCPVSGGQRQARTLVQDIPKLAEAWDSLAQPPQRATTHAGFRNLVQRPPSSRSPPRAHTRRSLVRPGHARGDSVLRR